MYERFYLLDRMPFENTPDPAFLHLAGDHREILAALAGGIASGKRWLLLTGDAGTGKTTLIQALLGELEENLLVIPVPYPQAGFEGIVHALSHHLSLHFIDRSNPTDTHAKLGFRLAQVHKGGKRAVMIIDEAHLLDETGLAELRRFSDHVNEDRTLLQIALSGQPEILETLRKGAAPGMAERIDLACELRPLGKAAVEAYVRHRLATAGRTKPLFDPKALNLIWKKSGGVPRVVNLLCDTALLIGYARGLRRIDAGVVQEAVDNFETGRPPVCPAPRDPSRHPGRRRLLVLISFLACFLVDGYFSQTAVPPNSMPEVGQAPPIMEPEEGMHPQSTQLTVREDPYTAVLLLLKRHHLPVYTRGI